MLTLDFGVSPEGDSWSLNQPNPVEPCSEETFHAPKQQETESGHFWSRMKASPSFSRQLGGHSGLRLWLSWATICPSLRIPSAFCPKAEFQFLVTLLAGEEKASGLGILGVEMGGVWDLSVILCLTHSLLSHSVVSDSGCSVNGILQARILKPVAISSSRASSWPRQGTIVSFFGRWILYQWAPWGTQGGGGLCDFLTAFFVTQWVIGDCGWSVCLLQGKLANQDLCNPSTSF